MRQIFLSMLLIVATFSLTINDASARGFGGGRGFGSMRSNSMFSHAPRAQRATSSAPRQANTSRWRGALGGLLIGSMLTSLFMGHGFGGALFSWFMIGMVIVLVVNFIRRKKQADLR